MEYSLLESTYKYDILAENIYQREKEYFHYQMDIENFNHMLANPIEGYDVGYIAQRIEETQKQQNICLQVYNALKAQITNQTAYDDALARRAAAAAAAAASNTTN